MSNNCLLYYQNVISLRYTFHILVFQPFMLASGQLQWLQTLRDRNDTAHIYDAALAERLVATIIDRYIPEFERMNSNVAARYADIL